MVTHISISWLKIFEPKQHAESTERRKTSFQREIVEKAVLLKPVLNKVMTTQE